VLSQLYHAEASKMNWWNSSQEFQQTLDMTLQDLMKTMVPDVLSVLAGTPADVSASSGNASRVVETPLIAATDVLPAVTESATQAGSIQQPATVMTPSKTTVDAATQLKKLKELKDLRFITKEEYESKRKELVGQL
jgi:uncharacterized protein (DUF2252 family)